MSTATTFRAGAGKAIISPKLGTRLHGYPSDRFATYIHDDLTAIAMRLDRFSPADYTLSIALAGGDNGYLPNKEEFERGGYEVWSSRYGTAYILTKDADSELIKQNLALIREMQT